MINQLIAYMQYPFVRYALIVGILIALCSSLLGVTLVLKRFSFIGDGLSHVAFGAMAVAAVAGIDEVLIDETIFFGWHLREGAGPVATAELFLEVVVSVSEERLDGVAGDRVFLVFDTNGIAIDRTQALFNRHID